MSYGRMPDVVRIPVYKPYITGYPGGSVGLYIEDTRSQGEVLFYRLQYKIIGLVRGLPSKWLSSLGVSITHAYQCDLCKTAFFIEDWDLNGLKHSCTNQQNKH